MRKFILKTLFLIFPLALFPQNTLEVSIIPEPVSMVKTQGSFILPKEITLIRPAGAANDYTVDFLKNKISKATGSRFKISNSGQGNLRLVLNKTHNSSLGSEGYTLSVNPQRILITANTPAGLFYGAQSLIQLFPPEIESKSKVSDVMWQIPAVEIADYPRVQWRGLMFDVARHFFTVEEVKRYIDQMSRYKYNRLHLGLTNDEGWRIEIKSLPKLTEIGAWRVEKIGNFGTFSPPLPDEPKNYGGYYTHEQIRDLVKYAKQRFVEIMPEINGPGHSLAAIASYPELASTPEAKNYSVRAGEPIIDWYAKPRHTSYIDNNLSPANEVVYEFLDKVITEVAELFPFEYIHCGGDETTYNFWEKSPEIAALMKRENLKNMAEVQSYFG